VPPVWFLALVAVGAVLAMHKTIRGFRGDGFYVFGQRQSGAIVVGFWIIFAIVAGIIAAEWLGFITDYAP
jgi:hypothetical protein